VTSVVTEPTLPDKYEDVRRTRGNATDEELLGATPGRPDAFAAFYRRHLGAVLALLLHRTRGRELTADLTAEVFAVALEQARAAEPPARGWLFGLAHRALTESGRRGRVEDGARRRLGMPQRTLTDGDLDGVVALADIGRPGGLALALVDGVPPAQRDAIVQGVLDQEIAVGELKRSKGVVRGPARVGGGGVISFFEILEADLVQAATLLSGAEPASAEPPRRRLRWRP
jgi:DNA-directed RNA polymerase specialized sigma24 family protein